MRFKSAHGANKYKTERRYNMKQFQSMAKVINQSPQVCQRFGRIVAPMAADKRAEVAARILSAARFTQKFRYGHAKSCSQSANFLQSWVITFEQRVKTLLAHIHVFSYCRLCGAKFCNFIFNKLYIHTSKILFSAKLQQMRISTYIFVLISFKNRIIQIYFY